jgi:hypothetical protein
MSLTNYARNKANDKLFGAIDYTPPANYYVALSTTTISVSGSNCTEPVGSGYARVLLPNTKSYFTYSSSGSIVNSGSIVWPISSGSWGTITDISFYDAVSSGSIWMFTTLTSPYIVQNGTTISFSASAINISQQ